MIYNYRQQRNWGKVIFSQVSVILFTGEGGVVSQHVLQVVSQHAFQQVFRGWYLSMPCRFPGPHPGGSLGGSGQGVSRPTPKWKLRGIWPGGLLLGGLLSVGWGAWSQGGLLPGGMPGPGGVWSPPRMATAAGGTHPTGMHSCLE